MEREAFVEWGRQAAVPVPTLDWQDAGSFSYLDPLLAGKRIVYLGEPDHNISERLDYRLLLLRYLIERGFRWVAAERGFSDGLRIDRYLASGEPAHLDRAGSLGYHGALRPGRDDDADPHEGRWPAEWIARHRAEERWFYTQLRELSTTSLREGDRLHFFGFDADMMPGGGYEDIAELVAPALGGPTCDEFVKQLAPVEGESLEAEVERLAALPDWLEARAGEFQQRLGDETYLLLIESVVALRDTFLLRAEIVRQFEADAPDPLRWYQVMAERERSMCRRMDWLLDRIGPDGKVVLVGHNEHLAKEERSLWLGASDQPPIPPALTLGHHLNANYPGGVCSFWLLFDRGRHFPHPMDKQQQMEVPSDPKRIEHLLAQIGPAYVLPLQSDDPRSALLDEKWDYWTGAASHSCIPRRQADAIFFLSEVHEPQPRVT